MSITDLFWVTMLAVAAGLDRTAAMQVMLARPIVAAPLAGLILGAPQSGLLVGSVVELLWLGRLPVGAAIPPDDTQVAIGGTTLSVVMGQALGLHGPGFVLLCVLVALPIGKIGQVSDRLVRHWNDRLVPAAETALAAGRLERIETLHLQGLGHFALASLITFGAILGGGSLALLLLAPVFASWFSVAAIPLQLALPLVGVAVVLGTINVNRSWTLFGAAFGSSLLVLWLV